MTESELESAAGDPPSVDMDAWRQEVFRLVHRRRKALMLEDGRLDILDLLLIASDIASGIEHQEELNEYEMQRLKKLERYEPDWKRTAEEIKAETDSEG